MADNVAAVIVGEAKARTTPLNQVATRCGPPNTNTAGHQEWVGTTVIPIKATAKGFRIRVDYMHLLALREADPGGPATYMASVEYPTGVHTRIYFGGAVKGVCPGLQGLVSDWVPVPITAGTEAIVTIQGASPGGSAYVPWNAYNMDMRDSYYGALSFSGADYTMGNAPPTNQRTGMVWPTAFLSDVDCPSALLAGTSRVVGSNETIDSTLDLGELARSVGQVMAYISIARSGDYASYFMGDHAARIDLAQYCTQAIYEYGINDIFNYGTSGFAAARLQRYTDAFLQMLPEGMPAFICTMGPNTNSTDGWTSTTNQTIPSATRETVRVNENNRRRAVPAGWAGCIDLADVTETARNSGIYRVEAGRTVTDGAMTSGSTTFTSATAAFTSADLGKSIFIPGVAPSAAALSGRIIRINSATSVEVNGIYYSTPTVTQTWVSAAATVSGATVVIGGARTNDGTHLLRVGNLAIKNANIIQPVLKRTPRPIKRPKRIEPTKGNVNVLPAGKTLLEQETGRGYSNEGASAQSVFNLPEALPGLTYTFIVQDADGIRVNAFSSDTIRIGASVSASAGNIQSTAIGSVVTLLAINQVEWIATAVTGTWAVA